MSGIRVYYQPLTDSEEWQDHHRLRLVHPNGYAEFATSSFNEINPALVCACCFSSNSLVETLIGMREYDKLNDWPPAVFLGYL